MRFTTNMCRREAAERMMIMFDIVGLGELLIDFAPAGERTYQANAGGAPANVLAACAKLGKRAAYIAMLGRDDFGDMLESDIRKAGVDASYLRRTDKACTTLAFVSLDAHGDRSFTFVRRPGADMLLSPADVDLELVKSARIFHFGSVSMTDEPSRSATLETAKYAHDAGVVVSYDPNLRPLLWKSLDEAKGVILQAAPYAHILKISEEELEFLTGITDLKEGSAKMMEYGPKVVFITLGPKGCFFRCKAGVGRLPTYDTQVVDTTGSGDAFLGGALTAMLDRGMENLDGFTLEQMQEIADYGNCAGSLVASKKGAIPSMPDRARMEACMREVPKLIV